MSPIIFLLFRTFFRYKIYKRMIVNCRQKCRVEAAGAPPIFPEDIEDLHFYEKKVKETLCLLMCNQEYLEIAGSKELKTLSRDIEQKLIDNRVYEYLHICYYQVNEIKEEKESRIRLFF